jgi:hypothetical protein
MKKLLATSALVSTVALTSVSFAQTTITGSLDLTYRSTTGGTQQGDTFLGRETQINLANKGKLSNGMDYAAGFSLEFDGMQTRAGTATTSVDNEGVYLNLISGGTTFTVGVDWIQNSKQDLINSVGDVLDEVATVVPGGTTLITGYTGASEVKESIGLGVVQNFGNGLTGSAYYAPNYENTGGGNNGQSLNNSTQVNGNGAYEIGLRGANIAGSGINLNIWKNEVEKTSGAVDSLSGTAYTIGYAKAPFSFDIGRLKSTAVTGLDKDTNLGQISYSVNKDITASLVRARTEQDNLTAKETINSLMVGYSLGPVGVLVTASRVENGAGARTAADIDQLGISLNTRF